MEQNKENKMIYENEIKNYEQYCSTYSGQYCNAFEVLNVGENSFSELFAWLFDIQEAKKNNTALKDSIQYKFFKAFLYKLYQDEKSNKEINSKYTPLAKFNETELDNFFNKLIDDVEVKTRENNMDIIIVSKSAKFILVIENKICAKISAKDNITQIEKYNAIVEKEYQDFEKKFVFICANNDYYPEQYLKQHCAQNDYCGKFADDKISKLLQNFGYFVLEYYDISIILYNILKEKNETLFYSEILKPASFEEMIKLIERISISVNDETFKISINKLIEQLQNNKNANIFNYQHSYNISGSVLIELRKILNNSDETEIENILKQFIEYCEMHKGNSNNNNFHGYTKIINGKLLWNICEEIKEKNKQEWKELKKDLGSLLPEIPEELVL